MRRKHAMQDRRYNLYANYSEVLPSRCIEYIKSQVPYTAVKAGKKAFIPCIEARLGEDLIKSQCYNKVFFKKNSMLENQNDAIAFAQRAINKLVAQYPEKYITRDEYLGSENFKLLNEIDEEVMYIQKNRIKEVRVLRGISRRKLAMAIGKADSSLNTYEANSAQPSMKTIESIAEFLGVTAEELIVEVGKSVKRRKMFVHDKVPNHIKEVMEKKFKTINGAIRYFCCSREMLRKYIDGYNLSPTILSKFCQYLGCNKIDLVDKEYWNELPLYGNQDKVRFKIKEMLKEKGMTQADLARHLDRTRQQVYHMIEPSDKMIKEPMLLQISSVLDCEPHELFEIENISKEFVEWQD